MTVKAISRSIRVGEKFAVLTAGTYDLTAVSGKPATCARRIHCYNAAAITMLKDPGGTDSPPGSVTAGTVFDADFGDITFTGGPIWVAW